MKLFCDFFFSSKNWFFFRLFLLFFFSSIFSFTCQFSILFFLFVFLSAQMKIDFSSSHFFRLFTYPLLGGGKKSLARFIDPHDRSAKISVFYLCMKNNSTFLSSLPFVPSNVNFHMSENNVGLNFNSNTNDFIQS